ncbi:MAG: hypothetical protein E7620_08110 [Ruminococcaceae bacterium]|nr:hypothetical protein [Oscillospiraceae bacterium]
MRRDNHPLKKRLGLAALSLLLCLCLVSCQLTAIELPNGTQESLETSLPVASENRTEEPQEGAVTEEPSAPSAPSEELSIPTYSGSPYTPINNNLPTFTEEEITTVAFERYHSRDSLGRCTLAEACLGQELLPTGDRGSISSVKPTGWHSVTYPGLNSDSLYNRCHLIAWSLSGENANWENLVTGTRYMNESGMLPFENMILDYIRETGNHVMYRVTPIFDGNDLLCRGVLMEAYSVEDRGEGISFHVFCHNVQPGILLDYATGDSRMDDAATGELPQVPEGATYIINKKSKKYHRLDSKYYGNLTSNMEYTTLSKAELEALGYESCGTCKP